jgi:cell wall-associated NlpC family hydrolase
LGKDMDAGYCLAFVQAAWTSTNNPLRDAPDPVHWWADYLASYPANDKATSSANSRFDTPPRGALAFWGGDKASSAGHVAIAVGNGWLVSTQEGDSSDAVHLINVDERNAEPGVGTYLGWVMP